MLSLSQPGWTSLSLIEAVDPWPVTVIHTACALAWSLCALAGAAVASEPPNTSAMTLAKTLMPLGVLSPSFVKDGAPPDGRGRLQSADDTAGPATITRVKVD
jgi:hypothetical protein